MNQVYCFARIYFFNSTIFDTFAKSQSSDGKVKSSLCKARES